MSDEKKGLQNGHVSVKVWGSKTGTFFLYDDEDDDVNDDEFGKGHFFIVVCMSHVFANLLHFKSCRLVAVLGCLKLT